MSLELFETVTGLLFYLGIFMLLSILLTLLVMLIMHFLMPRQVLDKYFKPPYFREMERQLFTGLPYAPMRTIMFMRAIAYPSSGKKRGITEAHLLVPKWYCLVSKAIIWITVMNFVLGLIFIAVGLLIYDLKEVFSQ